MIKEIKEKKIDSKLQTNSDRKQMDISNLTDNENELKSLKINQKFNLGLGDSSNVLNENFGFE